MLLVPPEETYCPVELDIDEAAVSDVDDVDDVDDVSAVSVVLAVLMISAPVLAEVDVVDVVFVMMFNPLTGIPKIVSVSLCTVVLVGVHVSPKSDS